MKNHSQFYDLYLLKSNNPIPPTTHAKKNTNHNKETILHLLQNQKKKNAKNTEKKRRRDKIVLIITPLIFKGNLYLQVASKQRVSTNDMQITNSPRPIKHGNIFGGKVT